LKEELVPLIQSIQQSGRKPETAILRRHFPIDRQRDFATRAATRIGFDFQRGRLDETAHPFCTEIGPDDVRITTRYDEQCFSPAFFGTLHEAGHGIYEQGLRSEQYGLPPGEFCSLGIHESQSRLWENLVGRSTGFWNHCYAEAQQQFDAALSDVSGTEFYKAINHVTPSLIRVEADEATYNLHIIIRFEIEQEIINGDLQADDVRDAWNARYRELLGVVPESDADGVLQDVHWSAGLIGYFPTYALGNLYASQFFEAAENELGNLDTMFSEGEFLPLKDWLKENIHQLGKRYRADELGELVSGSPLSHSPLMRHLQRKLAPIYGL
jgi:carboxypeptidase Taq